MDNNPEGKNLALLGYASAFLLYFHLVLFIAVLGVALLLNINKNRPFVIFHHRQMFGIAIIAILLSAFSSIIPYGWLALLLISCIVFIALMGLLDASRNQTTPLPLIGIWFQKWFSFIK